MDVPGHVNEPGVVVAALFANLEEQGLLPRGTTERTAAATTDGASLPPSDVYRIVHPVCDLDGDGTPDVLANELFLWAPPAGEPAMSTLVALSGKDGHTLWKRANLFLAEIDTPSGVSYQRGGEPDPRFDRDSETFPDLNGDGICDFVTFGLDFGNSISTPYLGDPSVETFTAHVRLLSGRDGHPLWETTADGTSTSEHERFFNSADTRSIRGFPTGFIAYRSPSGPKFLLKTTDLTYALANDPIGLSQAPVMPGRPGLFADPFSFEDLNIAEHLTLGDARTGALIWNRTLQDPSGARLANLTWISGVADLAGDPEPEIVLDQLAIESPRTTEPDSPIGGGTLARYARGMSVIALEGNPAARGATLWQTTVLDALAPRPTPPAEETYESLVWTRARISTDLEGDGRPDPVAEYTVESENAGTAVGGTIRTHFVPLHGSNGTPLWNVRETGWGFLEPLGTTRDGREALGISLVDVPVSPAQGMVAPSSYVRVGALDAATGTPLWTLERGFAEASSLSFDLAISQTEDVLAPLDLDGDGVRDIVTPAEANAPSTREQVLMATAEQGYEVRSGADGHLIERLDAPGTNGRLMDCRTPASLHALTFVSGHSRRLDVTRFDAENASVVWSHELWSDRAPRAATSGVNLVSLGATCADGTDGTTLLGTDAQLYSYTRGNEVRASIASILPDGSISWTDPSLPDASSTESLARASAILAPPPLARSILDGLLLGLGAGVLLGAASLLLITRLRKPRGLARAFGLLLVVALLLPVVGATASLTNTLESVDPRFSGQGPSQFPFASLGSAHPTDTKRAATSEGAAEILAPAIPGGPTARLVAGLVALRDHGTPSEKEAVVTRYLRDEGFATGTGNGTTYPGFDLNTSLGYTYPIGDIDSDGEKDVLVDQYCRDLACYPGEEDLVGQTLSVGDGVCGDRHYLYALSGRTGAVLWSRDITEPAVFPTCTSATVLGTLPLAGARIGILVYVHAITNHLFGTIESTVENNLTMLDARSGTGIWSFHETGALASDFADTEITRSLVVNPIIVLSRSGGPPALFLQGVGFEATTVTTTLTTTPGFDGPVRVLDAYSPMEWAARLDVSTGAVLWRTNTFEPEPGVSELPVILDGRPLLETFAYSDQIDAQYWGAPNCCGDVTGDGVPDLLFRALDWSSTPETNFRGPYGITSRVVAYDGKTGTKMFDTAIAKNIAAPSRGSLDRAETLMGTRVAWFGYDLALEPLGDVNHDGVPDLLTHETLWSAHHRQTLTARSGRDGSPLWNYTTTRDLVDVVMGDADHDGAPDLLTVEWYGYEAPRVIYDDFFSPRALPLVLRSGADGHVIANVTTFEAPADVVARLQIAQREGLPDADRDGVGDFFVDAPRALDDGTIVHEMSLVSGATRGSLFSFETVGALALPQFVDDLTGDGRQDVIVTTGDANDLWITLLDGTSGHAVWSRRFLALPTTGYALARPELKFARLSMGGAKPVLFSNMHLHVTQQFPDLTIGASGVSVSLDGFTYDEVYPQEMTIDAHSGGLAWALPRAPPATTLAHFSGPTPGEAVLTRLEAGETFAQVARAEAPVVLPASVGFLVAFGGIVTVGVLAARGRRLDAGVPDLD